MSEACVKQCYGFATLYRGIGGILNTLFKIFIIFYHLLSEIYKNKEWGVSMHALLNNSNLLQWVWLSYPTLSHEDTDKKQFQNDGKTAPTMLLSYYYVVPVRKVLFQAQRDRSCTLVKLLCIYFCYWDLHNHS